MPLKAEPSLRDNEKLCMSSVEHTKIYQKETSKKTDDNIVMRLKRLRVNSPQTGQHRWLVSSENPMSVAENVL
jgi:hypothetical protein